MIFYDLVMKQVRNSYKYSWDLAGFGLNRHDTVTNSLRFAIIYNMEILQRLRISQELDKKYAECMHKSGTNIRKVVTIRVNSWYFLS